MRYLIQTVVLTSALLLSASSHAQTYQHDSSEEPSRSDSISGRVLSESGQPIPNAMVFIGGWANTVPRQQRVSTDLSGNFQVTGLEPSLFMISASAPGYVQPNLTQYRQPLSNSPTNLFRIGDSVTITLAKGGVITGTVTDQSGQPIVGVGVRAAMVRDSNDRPPQAMTFVFGDQKTDDRGIYRIYGLPTGTYVISAGGQGRYTGEVDVYAGDSPTFAPASPREAAQEVVVHSGEETTGIDIRYRGDNGHFVRGTISGISTTSASFVSSSVWLRQMRDGKPESYYYSPIAPLANGFAFYGVPDGDYDLYAQQMIAPNVLASSETKRITVKGADVSALTLSLKRLATVSGRINLESSTIAECKNKRRPLFEETLVMTRRLKPASEKEQGTEPFSISQSQGERSGDFALRNLSPGRYIVDLRFFAKYWYLKSISQGATGSLKGHNAANDVGQNGMTLKSGDSLTNLAITLAEGAASIHGTVKIAEGNSIPPNSSVILVPVELDAAENALRYFGGLIDSAGRFSFSNVSPGKYWAIIHSMPTQESSDLRTLRDADQVETRAKLRREAENAKNVLELKPCQNLMDFELPSARP